MARSVRDMSALLSKKSSTAILILIAAVAGIIFGSLVGSWSGNLKFIGDMFIRLVQMSVVVLVMTAVASAIAKVGGKDAGRMGVHTFKWIIFFTVCSGLLGLALGAYTRSTGKEDVLDLVEGLNAVVMRIVGLVMKIAPIGIFCLLANVAGVTGFSVVRPMIAFLGALALGDLIQFVVYAGLTGALCRVNPLEFPRKFARLTMLAATTTSSAICLPAEIEDSVSKFGVSRRIANFTGPINMSMNSAGAVQCYVLAIMFMSQSMGLQLSATQIGMSLLLSILMCMGTIVVPGGMIVTYTFLATSLGLPLESIAILIGIDWFSGIFRTVMNVNVDVMVAMLVANKLGEFDRSVYRTAASATRIPVRA